MESKGSELRRYVEQANEIRALSSPQIRDIVSADGYRTLLMQNYMRIGMLAKENQKILDKYFFHKDENGDESGGISMEEMREFTELVIDSYNLTNMDAPLVYYQAKRILKQADESGDERNQILAMDGMITAAYLMICMTERLIPIDDVCMEYYREGMRAGERLLEYLDHDKFSALSDELKELIIIDARFIRLVSEIDDVPTTEEQRQTILDRMNNAMALADDPFYREQLPNYNWTLHRFRIYEYICSLTDLNNNQGYSKEQLEYINQCTKKMVEMYENEEYDLKSQHYAKNIYLYAARNGYLAGEIGLDEYKRQLERLAFEEYRNSPEDDIPVAMLQVPLEYMLVLDPDNLSPIEESSLQYIYNKLIGYLHQTPKKGMLTFLLSCLSLILKNFIEIPYGMDFETMGLSLIAAIHPMTYIHTQCVAEITKVLTYHLLYENPSLFVGMPGYATIQDVRTHRAEIEDFAYHAALCHDFGKLIIAETILTYGRNLLTEEYSFIYDHPAIGAYLLSQNKSTAEYADMAMGHHKWFNDEEGYPEDFEMAKSPYKTIVAIVACADCMDAATDFVGRSYKSGKTLSEFLNEMEENSGTRYAPFITELLKDEEVRIEIEDVLSKWRNENYRKAYLLLKKSNRSNDRT